MGHPTKYLTSITQTLKVIKKKEILGNRHRLGAYGDMTTTCNVVPGRGSGTENRIN